MDILSLGINYSTGDIILPPIDEETYGAGLLQSLELNIDTLENISRSIMMGSVQRGEVKRRVIDLGDPRSAGWTMLVNGKDPQKQALLDALAPLTQHRGMKDPSKPLVYNGEAVEDFLDWLEENYTNLKLEKKPHYILIAGGPEQVPFLFQAMLSTTAATGRVAFDSIDDLKTYVEKVIRLETAPEPVVRRETVFFAPAKSPPDPTYFSSRYLVEPMAEEVDTNLAFHTTTITGMDATKERLQETLRKTNPALLFTASHGLFADKQTFAKQQQLNGAICCERTPYGSGADSWLYRAEDIPIDEPFLEGGAFFQFACYGYGTPAESDFAHWDERIKPHTVEADFIAAIPKRALAHPRGPLMYIGHVDVALLHGFTDPAHPAPDVGERWHERIDPFVTAVYRLLSVEPVSLAMDEMAVRYNNTNAQLTNMYNRLKKGSLKPSPELRIRLANLFLQRADAQNYMVFGDPAACLRIPE